MMDRALESTFYFWFTTRAFATSIPTTLAGTPSIEIYEDGSATPITAGITLVTDVNSRTGLNRVTVVATTANGFESGKSYAASIAAGTVDSVSVVGVVVKEFSIDLLAAEITDQVWDEIISKAAHNIAGSAAKILRQGGDLAQIDGAVSDATPSVTSFDTNLTQPDTYFDDAVLIFSNGAANAGIGMPVSAYLNANGNMTFDAPDDWPVTPVNGDDFIIFATHVHPVAQILTTQMTESYAADGVAPTPAQALMLIQQALTEFVFSGTSNTIKKLDGSTTAAVMTLDDATNPTSSTRST